MTFLLLCLLVAPPSFAAGWFGHDWWMKSALRERVTVEASMSNLSKHAVTILFGLLVFGILGNIIYTNTVDARLSASESRQLDANQADLACISRTFEQFLTGNEKLREASARRDDALVGSKRALRELIRLRVIEGAANAEPAVRQAADQYLVQTQRFVEASKALREARKDYKLPDFEKACGTIPAK